MDKIISIAILAIIVGFGGAYTLGQDKYIGFKGGVSIPRLSGAGNHELTRDYKSRTAATFGIFADIGIRNRFSIQPEINYAGHGGKRNGIQPVPVPITGLRPLPSGFYYYANFNNTAVINYLEIPVLIKYRLSAGSAKRFYIYGGPFYGRLLNAHALTSGSSTIYIDRNGTPLLIPPLNQPLPPMPFNAKTDIKSELRPNNFGVTGGGGIEFPTGSNYFFADVHVAYGLTVIQKDTITNGSSHTGNLVLSVGYAFKWK
jgi:hypothetical protein